jgi:hypothetical protein
MKALLISLIFGLLYLPSALAEQIENEFMQGIFKYLAKNRNMNLVAYQGEKVGQIGRLYYIEEPDDQKTLSRWSQNGNPIKLFLYKDGYNLSDNMEIQKEEGYKVGEKYSDYLGAELQATLKEKGISLNAFKSALRNAEIRFSVVRKVVPALSASNMAQRDKQHLINEFNNFGQGKGVIMPFQELIVTNFRYNETASKELEAILGAEILKTLKAKLSANLIKTQEVEMGLPASSTIAIKPFPIYFKETSFWGRWF